VPDNTVPDETVPDETVPDETGAWLISHLAAMERGEAAWLKHLGRFDIDQGWYDDGQLSCAEWLMLRTHMARATAYEKLRIARQLRRRPLIAAAFAQGRLSYSTVRIITRIDDPDPDVDAALVDLAEFGTVTDVERAVAVYERYADQDRPPPDPTLRRSVKIVRHHDGTGEVHVTLTDIEVEEFASALQAFLDLHDHAPQAECPPAESPRGDSDPTRAESPWGDSRRPDAALEPGAIQSLRGDSPGAAILHAPPGRRADALMDLVRVGLAHAGGGHAVGDDRYLLHLVRTDDGTTTLADGTPIDEASAATVACDASTVQHHHSPGGEPLSQGRRHRSWSTAQRRAALIRDGGHCRFPGCSRRIADLHHQHPWAAGGPTDLDNGFLACPGHHTLLHGGFQAKGNPNRTLTFYRPDGTPIGHTTPVQRPAPPLGLVKVGI
jgi:hypothetical protein